MDALTIFMLAIIASLILIMVPRIYGDWVRFTLYREEGAMQELARMQTMENGWVLRHVTCAVAAIMLVAAMKLYPGFAGHDRLAAVTATYSLLSLMFAFAESLLAQKIAAVTATADRAGSSRVTTPR